jgi:hypothetical protein
MTSNSDAVFIAPGAGGVPLISTGDYLGLERSASPQLVRYTKELFVFLSQRLGFADTPSGKEAQTHFDLLRRNIYPEILIDIADRVYAQHERPAVVLNFDHLNANLHRDPLARAYLNTLFLLNRKMTELFEELARTVQRDPSLRDDPTLVRILSEGYAYYIYETQNYPWEETIDPSLASCRAPILDAATGLAGYSLMAEWPEQDFPRLVQADRMPFVVEGLRCFQTLLGKTNVEVVAVDFPASALCEREFGAIWANKFLHHLPRGQRKEFLAWVFASLVPGGRLTVIDTDLESRILRDARSDPAFCAKLNPGYLETLVEVEMEFCKNVTEDLTSAGFAVKGFDFHEYLDETDAYSRLPGDVLPIKFNGLEMVVEKPGGPEGVTPALAPQA